MNELILVVGNCSERKLNIVSFEMQEVKSLLFLEVK